MGKVKIINKSRKEFKCNRCGKVIPAGSKYYKGEINFGPTIVRCEECKLESWEVTTSDYQLSVGQLVYRWRDDYSIMEGVNEDIASALEEIRDDLQDRLDNMPEGLQYGDTGQLLQDRIDSLDSAIDDLNNIDVDTMKQDIADEFVSDCLSAEEADKLDDPTWDELVELKGEELETKMEAELHERLGDEIDSALSEIGV